MLKMNASENRLCVCVHSTTDELISRRSALIGILALLCSPHRSLAKADLPREVAGVVLPDTPLARAAAQYAREKCPDFLFNHCMRTFLFGAAGMGHHKMDYNVENAFVASSLHDLGLIEQWSSTDSSFEVDGANLAAQLARTNGANPADSEEIWWAVALHDGRFSLAQHRGGTAMLVAMGAGADVMGPDADMVDSKRSAEIVAAFPRLGFKKRFTTMLKAHCHRKPLSQRGTWLEGLCREQEPGVWSEKLEAQIDAAPFTD